MYKILVKNKKILRYFVKTGGSTTRGLLNRKLQLCRISIPDTLDDSLKILRISCVTLLVDKNVVARHFRFFQRNFYQI